MLLWFSGLSIVIVWQIFHDPAIDHRLVIAGALLPDLVDGPWGGARVMHSVIGSAVLLTVIMVTTRGHRLLRRRLLALPIGTFLHLVLDGAWTRASVFWWPFLGWSFHRAPLPSFGHPVVVTLLEEVVGAVALLWVWARFGLGDPERRERFVKTGRFARDVVG